MIDELIKKLEGYEKAYLELLSSYPNVLKPLFYENAKSALYVDAPYKCEQLFKILNMVAGEERFPTSNLSFHRMLEILKSDKNEIEALIEKSKTSNNLVVVGMHGETANSLATTAIEQIGLVAEMAYMIYNTARISSGRRF